MTERDLIDLAATYFKVAPERLSLDTNLREDLQADSLDLVEVAMRLEERLGVSLPEEQLLEIQTLGDVQTLLNGLVDAKRDTGLLSA